jgi:hypothetical protein
MSWVHGIYMLAALLLAIALGGAAAVYSEKPTMQKGATLLWAGALIVLTAALATAVLPVAWLRQAAVWNLGRLEKNASRLGLSGWAASKRPSLVARVVSGLPRGRP